MSPDHINGLFEFAGSILTAMNAWRVWNDRGYAGIYLPAVVFFSAWGMWNLIYYPSLRQWWSFSGGLCLVVANLAWLVGMAYHGRLPLSELPLDS